MNLKIEELNYLLTTKNEEVTDNLKKKARGIADDIFGKKINTSLLNLLTTVKTIAIIVE